MHNLRQELAVLGSEKGFLDLIMVPWVVLANFLNHQMGLEDHLKPLILENSFQA